MTVLESQPELQRGDVRTGPPRISDPRQQGPADRGVWDPAGVGNGGLPC